MHQHMKDLLCYLYTKPETTYTDLLKARYAAEVESTKGRALSSKVAAARQEEASNNHSKWGARLKASG